MPQEAKDLKGYRREVAHALSDRFLRQAMDKFAVAYRSSRERVFSGMDVEKLVLDIARLKTLAAGQIDSLFERFKANAERAGATVHLAATAREANAIIHEIARENGVRRAVKSKSMTAEETGLNRYLEDRGLEVTETDLGEWIVQLRREGPSHMVMPAIHLSRHQVADLFGEVTGKAQEADIEGLVKVARRALRQKFLDADMGITGANFALADTGTIGLVTNEGNARLVTSLPRVHVALVGLEKLVPGLDEALRILQVLPRNATGQAISSYVTWITGATECAATPGGRKRMHVVFLDNGRRDLAQDPVFSPVLRCVRCGACANVCPVYRMVGGHRFGHIYIGAIGLILTYFFHGRDKARNLVQNCISCGACRSVCAAGIDLPHLIQEVHTRVMDEEGHPLKGLLLSHMLTHRRLFHGLLKAARSAQAPVTDQTAYLRHLPHIFSEAHRFRALPAMAERAFREQWPEIRRQVRSPRGRVALFAGCLQDFVYPEQLRAACDLLAGLRVAVTFPMDQTCCGLPAQMMGETRAAREVARMNLEVMAATDAEHILTLCASCASHLKNAYPVLLGGNPALSARLRAFADRVVPLSVYLNDILGVTPMEMGDAATPVTWHSPCHLCRGLGVRNAPLELIEKSGYRLLRADEEETCCGFGGSYSTRFPGISAEILTKKLDDAGKTGARVLVTECPGCILQLRGGAVKRKDNLRVQHLAELLVHKTP
jgi:iron-sulfur cluster protein